MTTAEDVLRVARSQIGTVEAADGSNPYGAAYGMDRVAWCAEFVWWCFTQAGAGALIPKTAYTPTFFGWFRQHGQEPNDGPAVGDVVFFDWEGGSDTSIDHVGLVEAVLGGGLIQTVEGNTTPPSGTGSQGHGGGVWRRNRSMSLVAGWGRPHYSPAAPIPAPRFDPDTLPTLTLGMQGSPHVALWQKWSNAYPWSPVVPVLPVTGNYGPQTQAAVAAAQQRCGITGPDANGSIIGPRTKAAFAARGGRW